MKKLIATILISSLTSCSSVYYGAMEKVGVHKRDILVTRVKKAKEEQQDTKEVFQSALDQFISVTGYNGGELEAQYRKLNAAYLDAEQQAAEVKSRHDDVARVSKDLFREWDKEIKLIKNPSLRSSSQAQRRAASTRYQSLISQMRKAEKSLDPVLTQFRDHTLILKHHLNARAINSLEGELARTRVDVKTLIAEMEKSIREADAFLGTLQ